MTRCTIEELGNQVETLRRDLKADPERIFTFSESDFIGALKIVVPASRGHILAKLSHRFWYPNLQPLSNTDNRGDYLDIVSGKGYEFKASVVGIDNHSANFNQVRPHSDSEFLLCLALDTLDSNKLHAFLLDRSEVQRENNIFGNSTHGKNGKERSFHIHWSHKNEHLNRWLDLYLIYRVSVGEMLSAIQQRRLEVS